MKQRFFWITLFGFLLGNIFAAFFNIELSFVFLILVLASAFVFRYIFLDHDHKTNFSLLMLQIATFGIVFSFGMMRFGYAEKKLANSGLATFDAKAVEIIAEVSKDPVRKGDVSRVFVDVLGVTHEGQTKPIKGERVLLTIPFFKTPSYGDVLIVQGKLQKIKNYANGDFDFVGYSKKDRTLFQMYLPETEFIKQSAHPILKNLKSIKNFFETKLQEHISEPHSSLLSGMLLSGKGVLTSDIQDKFIKTGLIHIVVLSGFNIAIIITFIGALIRLISHNKKIIFIVTVFSLTLFVLMAGVSAPVVRSVLMASIVLLGSIGYRSLNPNKVLCFVAFILAFINPYSLPFDPSFQLSFLATFAIINFSTLIEKRLLFIRIKTIREIISQTIAVLLFVSPFILYTMGNFSVVALITNVLVLPIVPILMLLGFLVVALSFIPLFSILLSFITIGLSSYVFGVVEFFSRLPFASITIEHIPFLLVLFCYTILLLLLYIFQKKTTQKQKYNF